MRGYHLTQDAESDLVEIWLYTYEQWGREQADRYLDSLEQGCEKIVGSLVTEKSFQEIHPRLRAVLCQHHYIFFLTNGKPTIIGFLHERMDLLSRITSRL